MKDNTRPAKSPLTKLESVLPTVVSNLGLEKRLKEQTLLNLWPLIVGEQFSLCTRPLFIDYQNDLVVSVMNASIAQELSFRKREILQRLRLAGNTMGIKLHGLRFDLKHFHSLTDNINDSDEDSKNQNNVRLANDKKQSIDLNLDRDQPDKDALAGYQLTLQEKTEIEQIEANLIVFLKEETTNAHPLSKRVALLAERELRLQKWRQSKGYSLCVNCALPNIKPESTTNKCHLCELMTRSSVN